MTPATTHRLVKTPIRHMEPVSDRQLAAVPARTRRKYGARAEAFAQLEAGHAAQNILLQAAARGLAAVPVGSLDPARAAVTVALPPGQTVLYIIPAGHAP